MEICLDAVAKFIFCPMAGINIYAATGEAWKGRPGACLLDTAESIFKLYPYRAPNVPKVSAKLIKISSSCSANSLKLNAEIFLLAAEDLPGAPKGGLGIAIHPLAD